LKVEIRVDEADLGQIHVIYGDETVLAKALKFDYANGLSFWLHKKIRLLTRKWKSVRFTRLFERRRILFSWRPVVVLSEADS
jgi:hypothetical protein